MAEYRVTGPDGTQYKVTGPDGASDEQVLSQIKAYTDSQPNAPSGPPQPPQQALDQEANYKPPPQTGMLDKLKGVGEAALSVGSSALAGPIGGISGALKSAFGGKYGTPAGVEQGSRTASDVAGGLTYQPRTQAGQEIVGGIGKALESSKLAGMNPTQAMALGSIPRPPALAAAKGAVGKVGKAIADSPEGYTVGQGLKKVGAAMHPEIDPQVADLARKAEGMGIKVTPDMLTDNRILRVVGQASRDVPLSGSPAKGNREAFNRMVIKSFGGDEKATKITPAVFEKAMTQHGETIGSISAKNPIPYTPDFQARIMKLAANASNFETADVAKIINSYTSEIADLGRAKGQIDGVAFRKLRTKLTAQMRRTNNGDLRNALSELDDEMLDAIQGQLSAAELQTFNQARRYYANGKTVEPLIAKAATKGMGDMSPAALAGAVTRTASGKGAAARGKAGDLADVSAVGNRFMTEPGSSMTAERALAYGMLGNVGTLLKTLGMYAPANVYNRLGPRVARGMIPPPPPEP